MKRVIIFFFMGVLMATLMSTLFGCDNVDKKATEPILTGLKAKYGKSFTVYALGDRIDKDTATAYAYANDDPSLLFTVRTTKKGELVFENYAYRSACRSVEKHVKSSFAIFGITSECFVDFSSVNNNVDIGISASEYVKESSSESVVITIIAKASESITGEIIEKVYSDVYEQLSSIQVGTGLYILTSDDFDTVVGNVEHETQVFDSYRLKIHGAKDNIIELNIRITNEGLSPSVDEIDAELSKGVH